MQSWELISTVMKLCFLLQGEEFLYLLYAYHLFKTVLLGFSSTRRFCQIAT
jgi:hypothetical protein